MDATTWDPEPLKSKYLGGYSWQLSLEGCPAMLWLLYLSQYEEQLVAWQLTGDKKVYRVFPTRVLAACAAVTWLMEADAVFRLGGLPRAF